MARRTATRRRRSRRTNLYKSYEPAVATIESGVLEMLLPKKLVSPNRLKTGLARHGDTKAWEAMLRKVHLVADDGTLTFPTRKKMRLDVWRLAPSKKYFLDRTNAAFSVKGLEDALVRLGYLRDDSLKYLDGPYVEQDTSGDRKYWTLVKIRRAV